MHMSDKNTSFACIPRVKIWKGVFCELKRDSERCETETPYATTRQNQQTACFTPGFSALRTSPGLLTTSSASATTSTTLAELIVREPRPPDGCSDALKRAFFEDPFEVSSHKLARASRTLLGAAYARAVTTGLLHVASQVPTESLAT
eukprot:5640655-Pyramimonas_sp.AAC.1